MRWQDLAARAAFGAGIAAIPADMPQSWQVIRAELQGGRVALEVLPGIAWADGLLVELAGVPSKPVGLVATPLLPPIQTAPANTGAPGARDAVILEVWRRELNGYQVPAELIEPALGGPDTAERIETAYALRLYRLGANETCTSIIDALRDNLAARGTLHATLAPTTTTAGDCPVVLGGGYSGLEHDIYRIEIADVDAGTPMFKWSQWNGGLVGRGRYDATAQKLALVAGDQAILRSGLTSFYLEVLVHDATLGHWRVAYGANASLDVNGEIDLSGPASYGALPSSAGTWFIRVWNGLRAISDFPAGSPAELRDGIQLEFPPGAVYVPGDYWTFPVRAGMDNPSPLLDHAAPFGVHHHRVPLAELHWTGGPLVAGAGIEDCRIPLHPVTANDGCCTFSVGDGVNSHGDFTSVQKAIDALPATGGRVCVLPGEYRESIVIKNRRAIEIVGCGPRSKIIAATPPGEFNPAAPAIYALDTSGLRIRDLSIHAGYEGIGILLEADAAAGTVEPDGTFAIPFLEDLHVLDCVVHATGGSGIEIRGGRNAEILRNRVLVADQANKWSAITVRVSDAQIAHNHVEVILAAGSKEFAALGGIWLRGGCSRVDVDHNTILGGIAHGVMLGNVERARSHVGISVLDTVAGWHGYVLTDDLDANCVGCGPGDVVVPPPRPDRPTWVAGDPLRDIRIRDNSIRAMGLSGIGAFGFFTTSTQGIIVIERLEIANNRITDNLSRQLADIPSTGADPGGFGAISLPDVIQLVLRDNEIARNGSRTAGPQCGVFLLSGEGVEIARNRIVHNGPMQAQHIALTSPHGGIWIHTAAPPRLGRIAVAIRENEVHSPNGPALVMRCLGHAQVTDNAFTTESVQGYNDVATVYITNASLAPGFTTNASFDGLRTGAVATVSTRLSMTIASRAVEPREVANTEIAGTRLLGTRGFGIAEAIYIPPPGSILFSTNHCILYQPKARMTASVSIIGLADVDVADNHFHVSAQSLRFPVVAAGTVVRVGGNRFVEGQAAIWSVFAHGVYANATSNVADHCLLVTATTAYVKQNNIEINSAACRFFPTFPGTFGLSTAGAHV
ncbi:MAG: DUF6519 domain-containing protein [Kofleriaceae bacterium]